MDIQIQISRRIFFLQQHYPNLKLITWKKCLIQGYQQNQHVAIKLLWLYWNFNRNRSVGKQERHYCIRPPKHHKLKKNVSKANQSIVNIHDPISIFWFRIFQWFWLLLSQISIFLFYHFIDHPIKEAKCVF